MLLFAYPIRTISRTSSTIELFPNPTAAGNLYVGSVLESSCTSECTPVLRSDPSSNSLTSAGLERALFNRTLGTAAPDNITTTGGNNLVEGKASADLLDRGPGENAVSYETSPEGVTISLATGRGSRSDAEGDQVWNFQDILGSSHGDVLIGDASVNILYGMNGDDIIEGKESGDVLNGGDGVDTLSYTNSTANVTISLATNTANGGDATGDKISNFENLVGSRYADSLTGDAGNNDIQGGPGADRMDGGPGTDTLSYTNSASAVAISLAVGKGTKGDATDDEVAKFENIIGSDFDDILIGNANANYIQGKGGDDVI